MSRSNTRKLKLLVSFIVWALFIAPRLQFLFFFLSLHSFILLQTSVMAHRVCDDNVSSERALPTQRAEKKWKLLKAFFYDFTCLLIISRFFSWLIETSNSRIFFWLLLCWWGRFVYCIIIFARNISVR